MFIHYQFSKIGICTCLFFVWLSCKQQENKSIIPLPPQVTLKATLPSVGLHTVQSLKQYLIDSIDCFADSSANDTICRDENDHYCVYTGMINQKRVAIIVIQDSAMCLVQERNGKCIITDSTLFNDYALDFVPVHLNSDNQTDFLIESYANMNGMKRSYMLIADSTGYLHFHFYLWPNDYYINLWNVSYDSSTNLIRSYYEGSAFGRDMKELYCWVENSLQFFRGAELDATNARSEYPRLRFYKEKMEKSSTIKQL